MSKAYKCDICDKLYVNPSEFADKTDPVTGVAIGFIPTGLMFTDADKTKHTMDHDICPECMQFFRKVIPVIREKGDTDWIVWPK